MVLPRGVYKPPWRKGPFEFLVAINVRGVQIAEAVLQDGLDEESATEWLWSVLERVNRVSPTVARDHDVKARRLSLVRTDEAPIPIYIPPEPPSKEP